MIIFLIPKGLLTIPIENVREVDVAAPRGHWHFLRTQDGWRATQRMATERIVVG